MSVVLSLCVVFAGLLLNIDPVSASV
jgi:hypothetical protein